MMTNTAFPLALLTIAMLSACGGGGSSSGTNNVDNTDQTDNSGTTNTAPTVNAGADQNVSSGQQVTLNATITDDDEVSVNWTQLTGTQVEVTQGADNSISFTAPEVDSQETLSFEVSADDGTNAPVSDQVDVIVSALDGAPSVNAGADIQIDAGQDVTISPQITDDGEVSVSWSQLSGPSVEFTQADDNSISFTAPDVDNEEILTFEVSADDGVNALVSDQVNVTVVPVADDNPGDTGSNLDAWIINNATLSDYISADNGGGVLENVQLAEIVSVSENNSNVDYMYVQTTGIPRYDVTVTQELVDELNARPQANRDFRSGTTTAVAGQVVNFGEDIGYDSSNENCPTTGGDGYWPPGPVCPTEQDVDAYFPVKPNDLNNEECDTGLGKIGLMVNGTSIYNWGDGQSWGDNIWYNLAPIAEQYDVDICGGHAAQGDYHHHFYTSCLAELVGDDGTGHSPIYGFAADGYPVYGPYESAGVFAVSGWQIRDYGASTSEGGCGTAGQRSCILVDPYDISAGVEFVDNGPDIGETVTTLSGNSLSATDGYYFEDYYYAGEPVTGAQLDQHNGHDSGDGRGYHYHITLTLSDEGELTPSFPFTIGPGFKGELADNSFSRCSTDDGMPPPPGG